MTALSTHAQEQAAVWGTDARGWADYAEGHNEPLFVRVLDVAHVGEGTRLLDVGCGAGRVLRLASDRGALVTGLDVSQPLLDVARERVPDARLLLAEMDVLPFDEGSFDTVVGVNAFQFAADPMVALAEAGRVLAPGGRLVASLFAGPERSESTAIHQALSALVPPSTGAPTHTPYLLSEPGNLEAAVQAAGLELLDAGEVPCVWAYDTANDAVRGLLASAGGARAAAVAGRAAVDAAIRTAVGPFTTGDGSIRMHNTFRWLSADKPA
ncbi:class I SAM-dependent methyltransferase [Acidothermaceae bacterium B102]|nr:class I SAM-dependent methyltransferase [Acidothermaceae bacterium B102]